MAPAPTPSTYPQYTWLYYAGTQPATVPFTANGFTFTNNPLNGQTPLSGYYYTTSTATTLNLTNNPPSSPSIPNVTAVYR